MFTVVILFEKSGETYSETGMTGQAASDLVSSLGPQVREYWDWLDALRLVHSAEDDARTGEATRVLTGKSGKRITVTVTAE